MRARRSTTAGRSSSASATPRTSSPSPATASPVPPRLRAERHNSRVATAEASRTARLRELLAQRILVLDGAWGTMLQRQGLSDADYRGERFRDHPREVAGDPDLLNLTRPDVVLGVHRAYLDAGADITTTNTFTATSIGQADYGLEEAVYELNLEGAQARAAGLRRAPTAPASSPARGAAQPDALALAQRGRPGLPRGHLRRGPPATPSRCAGCVEGGVDLLLIETIFDTLNAKAAIVAARDVLDEHGRRPAALDLGHDRRPLRPNALGPDPRGLLDLGRARATR